MKYEIIGGQLPAVVCKLDRGEKMFTESGAMCWMEEGFSMDSNTRGGLLKGLGRAMSGESIFLTTYKAVTTMRKLPSAPAIQVKFCLLPCRMGRRSLFRKRLFLLQRTG